MRTLLLVGVMMLAGGCVEREIQVISDPPGAEVYLDGKYMGLSPATTSFTFYGTREVEVRKAGYEVVRVKEKVAAPAYERFPVDFVSEVVIPKRIRDKRVFRYQLVQERPEEKVEGVYQRAEELGEKMKGVEESGGKQKGALP